MKITVAARGLFPARPHSRAARAPHGVPTARASTAKACSSRRPSTATCWWGRRPSMWTTKRLPPRRRPGWTRCGTKCLSCRQGHPAAPDHHELCRAARPRGREHDFIIGEIEAPGFVDCAAIESPGLSSAPAIGAMVAEHRAGQLARWKKSRISTRRARAFLTRRLCPLRNARRLSGRIPPTGRSSAAARA